MGKPSKREGLNARELHEAIRDEARRATAGPRGGAKHSAEWPALDGLMRACRGELVAGIPTSVIYEGRRYFLRFHLVLTEVEVFEGSREAAPLFRGALGLIEGASVRRKR